MRKLTGKIQRNWQIGEQNGERASDQCKTADHVLSFPFYSEPETSLPYLDVKWFAYA